MIFSSAFTTWASQNHPRFRSAPCPFYLPIREYNSSISDMIGVSRGASSCQIVLCFLFDVGHIDSPVARCRARTGARIWLTRRSTTREFMEVCIVPYGKCLHSRASRLHVPETGALSRPASCYSRHPHNPYLVTTGAPLSQWALALQTPQVDSWILYLSSP